MPLPAGIVLRRGRPGDAAQALELVSQLGYAPDPRTYDETFAQVVRHPESAVFVATEGLKLVGYLALSHRPQIRLGGRVAVVDELSVASARRGEGIGGALLQAAIEHALGLGCRRIEVSMRRSREGYQRGFYIAQGLVEVDSATFRLEPLPTGRRK
jgi:GNAT superfamily N-acetyltransferase